MSSSNPLLEVRGLSAAWDGTPVLRDIQLEVREGEIFVLLGPNGSGKTTLLRCLAGLETPTQGTIRLDGVDITRRPPHQRGVVLMFQDPALFPHRTVYENIAYAPLLRHRPLRDVEEEVGRLIELLHLNGFEDRRPNQLSGGELQRVALARTLAARPRLVLLDEPFASIDVELKAELRAEFRHVLRASGTSAIHVTHDREEGLFLGDRVGLLFEGRLEEPGSPSKVFGDPRTPRAARFLGYNILLGRAGTVGVLPADLHFLPPGAVGLDATVLVAGPVGRENEVVLRTHDGQRLEMRTPASESRPEPGTRVTLGWNRSVDLTPE
ncbi:MAG TPA: ABC transporter ATP-binding protein [Thermoplasmata archaeon]|nr:ABC transporter ATP-binding protein [Thermoplasmata archaeon]